jgi:hypothetical protein
MHDIAYPISVIRFAFLAELPAVPLVQNRRKRISWADSRCHCRGCRARHIASRSIRAFPEIRILFLPVRLFRRHLHLLHRLRAGSLDFLSLALVVGRRRRILPKALLLRSRHAGAKRALRERGNHEGAVRPDDARPPATSSRRFAVAAPYSGIRAVPEAESFFAILQMSP